MRDLGPEGTSQGAEGALEEVPEEEVIGAVQGGARGGADSEADMVVNTSVVPGLIALGWQPKKSKGISP